MILFMVLLVDEAKILVAHDSEEWVKLWSDYREAKLPDFKPFDDLPKIPV